MCSRTDVGVSLVPEHFRGKTRVNQLVLICLGLSHV